MAVAAGNLWFVCSIGCNINVANHTNHKFPAATLTGIPSEVKSTVLEGLRGQGYVKYVPLTGYHFLTSSTNPLPRGSFDSLSPSSHLLEGLRGRGYVNYIPLNGYHFLTSNY